MTQQKIIAQGAEAKIILSGNFIIKDRIKNKKIPKKSQANCRQKYFKFSVLVVPKE